MSGFAERFLLSLIGYCMIFLCAAMCYMPMVKRLRLHAKKLVMITIPVLLALSVAGSLISAGFCISHNAVILPASVFLFLMYYKTLDADIFECLFVFMFVMSLSCYPYHYALLFDVITNPNGSYELFSVWVELLQELFVLLIAVIFFFMRRQIAEFTENLGKIPMKRIFWLIPSIFTVILLMLIPLDYNTIYTGRLIYLYPIIITTFFLFELIIVSLFARIARELLNNEKLERENQMLEFQSKRYENLKNHMEQTARIRHDFRQQLHTISVFAENGKYDELKKFLAEYTQNISGTQWETFCQNSAVDALLGYYLLIARQRKIRTDWRLELPKELPVSESIFCGMLGNLIENSIGGCETLPDEERIIHLSAQMPSASMLTLVIENSYDGALKTDKSGEIISSKHKESGIGLRSVRTVVEKYHGRMQIEYDDRIFRVSVLLNLT